MKYGKNCAEITTLFVGFNMIQWGYSGDTTGNHGLDDGKNTMEWNIALQPWDSTMDSTMKQVVFLKNRDGIEYSLFSVGTGMSLNGYPILIHSKKRHEASR